MESNQDLLVIRHFNLSRQVEGKEVTLLQDINLRLPKGKITTLTGCSGCGKTLLSRSIIGLARVQGGSTSGDIEWSGEPGPTLLTRLTANIWQTWRGKRIGMIFQDPLSSFDPVMTCGEQLSEAVRAHKRVGRTETKKIVLNFLADLHLEDAERMYHSYPHQLSGGQLQRLSIAAAMIHRPALLIADEATSALDPKNERDIINLVHRFQDNYGTTVLWISHDLETAAPISDQIIVMEAGRIVENNNPESILKSPQHPTTRALITSKYIRVQTNNHKKNTILLTLSSISKRHRKHAVLENLDLHIHHGERLALVGPSGSGKSTLARLITGQDQADLGLLQWTNEKNEPLSSGPKRVQMIFQHPAASLNPKRTIRQSLKEPFDIHHLDFSPEKLDKILRDVGLHSDILDRYPSQLSGGQLQRVSLARSLVLLPDLLILDEAVSALDKVTQKQIMDLLDQVHETYGMAFLFITHDEALAEAFADRVITFS
ncbi:MAG: ABC transporter ATP-binding protein [Saprospiraceae bacterium]|nr:ABC transporter ATP-binding protein [Saprospiraceae bacterium]